MKQLDYAANEAARRLINGEIDENAAVQWLQKYAVMEPARAQQRVKFIKRYRSYVINYNLGEDMVRRYIEKRSGADPEKRWSEFAKLLSSPRLPSGLTNESRNPGIRNGIQEIGKQGEKQRLLGNCGIHSCVPAFLIQISWFPGFQIRS